MEFLDVVDETGCLTGEVVSRGVIHEIGLWYRSSHVWIVRKRGSVIQLLLQKRSANKDSCANCFDVSCAGHVSTGMNCLDTAIKELREELNLVVDKELLCECGVIKSSGEVLVNGRRFIDKQIARVYILWLDVDEVDLQFNKDEIEVVKWFDFDECVRIATSNEILNCINVNELKMIEKDLLS